MQVSKHLHLKFTQKPKMMKKTVLMLFVGLLSLGVYPKKPEEPIMPGKVGKIEVKYDTNRVGPIRKAITVTSNADTPTKVLKIKGTVKNPGAK